jgi:hypothetical protein
MTVLCRGTPSSSPRHCSPSWHGLGSNGSASENLFFCVSIKRWGILCGSGTTLKCLALLQRSVGLSGSTASVCS